jgi:hypothetical protein
MEEHNEKNDFVAYVGPADLHDAHILSIYYSGDQLRVTLQSHGGKKVEVLFSGVKRLRTTNPVGMMIYAVNEMRAERPLRRFVFANWDEEDTAYLELEAQDFAVLIDGSRLAKHQTERND